MKYPNNLNELGSFQELAHSKDVEFGQLGILRINPGCTRGGHYHTHKREWFCCINGKCKMEITNVKTGTSRTITLNDNESEFSLVEPFEAHSVVNLSSNKMCELLIIASEEFNPKDPDTYKYQSIKEA